MLGCNRSADIYACCFHEAYNLVGADIQQTLAQIRNFNCAECYEGEAESAVR